MFVLNFLFLSCLLYRPENGVKNLQRPFSLKENHCQALPFLQGGRVLALPAR